MSRLEEKSKRRVLALAKAHEKHQRALDLILERKKVRFSRDERELMTQALEAQRIVSEGSKSTRDMIENLISKLGVRT